MKIVIITDKPNKSILELPKEYPHSEIIITDSIEKISPKEEDHIIFLKKDKFNVLGKKYLFLTEGEKGTVKENYFVMKSFRDVYTNIRKVLLLTQIILD